MDASPSASMPNAVGYGVASALTGTAGVDSRVSDIGIFHPGEGPGSSGRVREVAQNSAGKPASDHRDTPPEDDSLLPRQIFWLAGQRSCPAFPKSCDFSDTRVDKDSPLIVAVAARI